MKLLYSVFFMALPFLTYSQSDTPADNREEKPRLSFKMYPNPAYGKKISIVTESIAPKQISIYDVFGEIMISEKIQSNVLDISRLMPGVYVLQVIQDSQRLTRKLVVK